MAKALQALMNEQNHLHLGASMSTSISNIGVNRYTNNITEYVVFLTILLIYLDIKWNDCHSESNVRNEP